VDFVQGDWNGNGVGVVVHWVGGLKRKGFYKNSWDTFFYFPTSGIFPYHTDVTEVVV
jgi:hypothetical protein